MALSDLESKGLDQRCLLAVIQAELASALIDQFELPRHQCETVFQRAQRLIMQVHMILGVIEQAMNVQRKFRNGDQGEGIGLAGQFEEAAHHAVDCILVIADQLQMTQAFLGFGQERFSLDKKLREPLGPLFTVVRHTYLHNVMSNEGMSCVSAKTFRGSALQCRCEIAIRPAGLQAREFERVDGH
ncbi:hypothetical protein J2Y86_001918 [Pseudomonas migulae]|nr:hypothetical protein [Pseudomonas migulae]